MDYESFSDQFINEMQLSLEGQGIELERHEVTKNNGVVKDSVTVKGSDTSIAPVFYLDNLYELHKDGYSISELVDKTIHDLDRSMKNAPKVPDLTAESAKENLYCTVINTLSNEERLKNVPHEKLEDLSVVARFKVGNDGSFLVTNDICKTLRMTAEEVLEAAHANTERQKFTCQSMNDVLREIIIGEGMPESYADEIIHTQGEQCPMWVLSNESRIDGAVAMASQDTLKEAHEKLGEDYYILPSSRHEVILVPQSMVSNVEDLKSMVHEVNITEVSETDRLSDSVYHFNGKHLSIADTVSETLSNSLSESVSRGHSHSH